jgi:hypothetical protein
MTFGLYADSVFSEQRVHATHPLQVPPAYGVDRHGRALEAGETCKECGLQFNNLYAAENMLKL